MSGFNSKWRGSIATAPGAQLAHVATRPRRHSGRCRRRPATSDSDCGGDPTSRAGAGVSNTTFDRRTAFLAGAQSVSAARNGPRQSHGSRQRPRLDYGAACSPAQTVARGRRRRLPALFAAGYDPPPATVAYRSLLAGDSSRQIMAGVMSPRGSSARRPALTTAVSNVRDLSLLFQRRRMAELLFTQHVKAGEELGVLLGQLDDLIAGMGTEAAGDTVFQLAEMLSAHDRSDAARALRQLFLERFATHPARCRSLAAAASGHQCRISIVASRPGTTSRGSDSGTGEQRRGRSHGWTRHAGRPDYGPNRWHNTRYATASAGSLAVVGLTPRSSLGAGRGRWQGPGRTHLSARRRRRRVASARDG